MAAKIERVPLGQRVVPVSFGDQVITSLLFNHDANPVHHKPDHAVQWMMGLLSTNAVSGAEERLAMAGGEERTYTLGYRMLRRQESVVMPGIILAAISYECFIKPTDRTVSITTTFTYPLLVPTKGMVEVEIEAYELPGRSTEEEGVGRSRHVLIEAYGPSVTGSRVQVLKLEAVVYPKKTSPDALYENVVSREFKKLERRASQSPDLPQLQHPGAISEENRRQYAQIVGADRKITPSTWQAKIPRALTEFNDRLRVHEGYLAEVKAYYEGRADEAERRQAIERYVMKEQKYRCIAEDAVKDRVEAIAGLTQRLYARQHTVFDPRMFSRKHPAVTPGSRFVLDLRLYELRLRRGIHRFYTGALIDDQPVFMGDAMVSGQPLATQGLLEFLCEINHSFETLQLFEYQAPA
jgi:hypothetical protein